MARSQSHCLQSTTDTNLELHSHTPRVAVIDRVAPASPPRLPPAPPTTSLQLRRSRDVTAERSIRGGRQKVSRSLLPACRSHDYSLPFFIHFASLLVQRRASIQLDVSRTTSRLSEIYKDEAAMIPLPAGHDAELLSWIIAPPLWREHSTCPAHRRHESYIDEIHEVITYIGVVFFSAQREHISFHQFIFVFAHKSRIWIRLFSSTSSPESLHLLHFCHNTTRSPPFL